MAAGNAWGRLRTAAPLPAAFLRQRTGYHLGPNRACADRRHLHIPALVSDDYRASEAEVRILFRPAGARAVPAGGARRRTVADHADDVGDRTSYRHQVAGIVFWAAPLTC